MLGYFSNEPAWLHPLSIVDCNLPVGLNLQFEKSPNPKDFVH